MISAWPLPTLSCSAKAEHPVIADALFQSRTPVFTGSSAFADDDSRGGEHDSAVEHPAHRRGFDGESRHRNPRRLSRRPAALRRYRKRRSVGLRHQGHAGELRSRQGRPPRHVRRYGATALVRQDRQRRAHRRRPGGAGSGAAPRHRARDDERAAAAEPGASAVAHRSQQQCRHRRAGDRIRVSSRRRLDRADHRAQRRPVRFGLSHAVSRRRHRRHQALLSRYPDRLRQARAGLPAGHRRRRSWRLEGHLHGARQAGVVPARRRLAQSGSENRGAGGGVQGYRQQYRHGRHGFCRLLHGDRLPHRSRLLPHRRHADVGAHVLSFLSTRVRAYFDRRQGDLPHRPDVVHRLHAARNGRMGPAGGRGGRTDAAGI